MGMCFDVESSIENKDNMISLFKEIYPEEFKKVERVFSAMNDKDFLQVGNVYRPTVTGFGNSQYLICTEITYIRQEGFPVVINMTLCEYDMINHRRANNQALYGVYHTDLKSRKPKFDRSYYLKAFTQLALVEKKNPNHEKVLYSGGCQGGDYIFGVIAEKYGYNVDHYYGFAHKTPFGNSIIDENGINEGLQVANRVARFLKKNTPTDSTTYVANMIGRNWHQVKNTEAVYAVQELTPDSKHVESGTSWAVEEAIRILKVPYIYVLDPKTMQWYQYQYGLGIFQEIKEPNEPPSHFSHITGIGSRTLKPGADDFIAVASELNKLFNRK